MNLTQSLNLSSTVYPSDLGILSGLTINTTCDINTDNIIADLCDINSIDTDSVSDADYFAARDTINNFISSLPVHSVVSMWLD